ncbi:MAG: type 1 glutamine amidotransferase [Planctomycetota bacterium]
MRIAVLQHVPFEGPAAIASWADAHGHELSVVHLYQGQTLPEAGQFDALVVMGGPMSVHDEADHPWLASERALIRRSVEGGAAVLGVCLGAQQLALAMGGSIDEGASVEHGWWAIEPTEAAATHPLGAALFDDGEPALMTFHWHADLISPPPGSTVLARTAVCACQAFVIGERALGIQCHIETTPTSAAALIEHCGHEADGGLFSQPPSQMLTESARFEALRPVLDRTLSTLLTGVPAGRV